MNDGLQGTLRKLRLSGLAQSLDEIHEMPTQCQTLLYRALEDRTIFVSRNDQRTFKLPLQDFCLIAATTDEYSLLAPLRDRFKLVLQFEHYDAASLATITLQRAKMMGIVTTEQVTEAIAARSRGTPRLAIRLLESCHRYARSVGHSNVTLEHFERTVQLEQIDKLGLDSDQQRYLAVLAKRNGEAIRLHTMESMLGIHHRTIQQVVEPFMLRLALIERTPQGRRITERGLEHLGFAAE